MPRMRAGAEGPVKGGGAGVSVGQATRPVPETRESADRHTAGASVSAWAASQLAVPSPALR
jgi:hypothetical protein